MTTENKKPTESKPPMAHAVTVVVVGDRLQINVDASVASLGLKAAAELCSTLDDMVRQMRATKTVKDSKWTND